MSFDDIFREDRPNKILQIPPGEENPKVVSEALVYLTIVLTLDTYFHVLPTMQQGATNRLEKLLYSKRNARSSDTRVTQTKTGSESHCL